MYKELCAMAYLARQLNLTEDANQYGRAAMELIDAVREYCWDEKDGMYYSVDLNLLPYTGESQIIFGKDFVLHEGAPRDYPCLIQRIEHSGDEFLHGLPGFQNDVAVRNRFLGNRSGRDDSVFHDLFGRVLVCLDAFCRSRCIRKELIHCVRMFFQIRFSTRESR